MPTRIAAGHGRAAEGELRRIAREGRSGAGWLIPGSAAAHGAPCVDDGPERRPGGRGQVARLQQLAGELESGVGVRLLCHCRRVRAAGASECMPCHCEVLAPIIEGMATSSAEPQQWRRRPGRRLEIHALRR